MFIRRKKKKHSDEDQLTCSNVTAIMKNKLSVLEPLPGIFWGLHLLNINILHSDWHIFKH